MSPMPMGKVVFMLRVVDFLVSSRTQITVYGFIGVWAQSVQAPHKSIPTTGSNPDMTQLVGLGIS